VVAVRRGDSSAALALGLGVLGVGIVGAIVYWPRKREPAAGGNAGGGAGDPVSVQDEAEALARVITSEAGSTHYSDDERRMIAWTVRNRARRRGTTIARLVCSPCGAQGKDRPFSSARPATASSRVIARQVLEAPQANDPTSGATAFFEPHVQDLLVAQGRPGYRFTSAELRERWQRGGQQPKGAIGAFEFWT
jgi:hypothetical protein